MQTVYVDQMSGASADLFTFTLDRGVSWEVHMLFHLRIYSNIHILLISFMHQLANTMLDEKQKAGFCSDGDGFYKSNREWMGKHHFILAFERYHF